MYEDKYLKAKTCGRMCLRNRGQRRWLYPGDDSTYSTKVEEMSYGPNLAGVEHMKDMSIVREFMRWLHFLDFTVFCTSTSVYLSVHLSES